MKVIQTLN